MKHQPKESKVCIFKHVPSFHTNFYHLGCALYILSWTQYRVSTYSYRPRSRRIFFSLIFLFDYLSLVAAMSRTKTATYEYTYNMGFSRQSRKVWEKRYTRTWKNCLQSAGSVKRKHWPRMPILFCPGSILITTFFAFCPGLNNYPSGVALWKASCFRIGQITMIFWP